MWEAFQAFRWRDAIDILLVAAVLYRVFLMFRGTLAVQMLIGLGLLAGASFLSRRLELFSTSWILDNFWSFWALALVILFQPELRRALAQVGRSRAVEGLFGPGARERSHVAGEIVKAVESLAAKRVGALIVIERATGLRQYAELGVAIDALVSADLLGSLFLPYSPLHDGAVFIRGGRIVAAGCFLPLSRATGFGRSLGTRHRAALGITEETDAVAVAVSEETGKISLAVDGRMETDVSREALRERLLDLSVTGTLPATRPSHFVGVVRRLLVREKA